MRHRLMRLSPSHFAVLVVGLAPVMLLLLSLAEPWLPDMYASEIGLPAMGRRYGFTYGAIRFHGEGFTFHGIVDLDRDRALARLGLRMHDMPTTFDSHGHGGAWALYEALSAIERGDPASLTVVNADDWVTGRSFLKRRIDTSARR